MNLSKIILALFITLSLVLVSCEKGLESNDSFASSGNDTENAIVQSVDDEIGLLNKSLFDDSSDVTVALSWGEIKRNKDDEPQLMGHALAIAHDANAEKTFFRPGGLDMGDVTLSTPTQEITLNAISPKQARGTVYISAPKRFKRSHFGLEPELDIIDFVSNGTYTFTTTGSDDIEAMNLSIVAPAALPKITNLADGAEIGGENDLVIEWSGASANSQIILVIVPFKERPAMNGKHNGKGKGGHGKGGKGKHGGKPQGSKPGSGNHIRLGLEDGSSIVKSFTSNLGTATIPASEILNLIENTSETMLMLHLAAVDVADEVVNSKTVRKLIRMNDRIVLAITQ